MNKEELDRHRRLLIEKVKELQQENKQLKEELENDIDRYEDTISYQLGFDKGKEYMQQKIDKAIEYIKETELYQVVYDDEGNYFNTYDDKATADLLQILGDKENE